MEWRRWPGASRRSRQSVTSMETGNPMWPLPISPPTTIRILLNNGKREPSKHMWITPQDFNQNTSSPAISMATAFDLVTLTSRNFSASRQWRRNLPAAPGHRRHQSGACLWLRGTSMGWKAGLCAGADNCGDTFAFVLLGNGDGTFQTPITLRRRRGFLATGDFNGDGKADLFITSEYSGRSEVLLGNGDGTFPQPILSFSAAGPGAVVDLNHDGIPDVVASTAYATTANEISVLGLSTPLRRSRLPR